MASSEEALVKTSVRITKSLHKELKHFCTDTDRTEVDVIADAIGEYIQRHKKK